MEPILTLPYSEWLVAEQLMKYFPSKDGYSVFAPLSRQEKGVDLMLTRRLKHQSRAITIQVKYSRAYARGPRSKFKFIAWFRKFEISERADFYALTALYPHITGKGNDSKETWWKSIVLVFPRKEMEKLIKALQTQAGLPENMFYLGFNDSDQVFLTRGAPIHRDLTSFLLAKQIKNIKQSLSSA